MLPYNKRTACALISKLSLALIVAAALAVTSRSLASPGDVYVTNLADGSVVVYTPAIPPVVKVFDTGLISPQGIAFDQAKSLYVVDAGDGGTGNGTIYKYDITVGGSSRTVFRTGFSNPLGLTLDGSDLLVAENGAVPGRVQRVPLDGIHPPEIFRFIDTPMGLTSHAFGQAFTRYIANGPSVFQVIGATTTDIDPGDSSRNTAVDGTGNVFITTDTGHITEVQVGGAKGTFASGFTQPTGMDFRPAKFPGDPDNRIGFLYVADTTTGTISQISKTGIVSSFATGTGMPNYLAFETAGAPVVVTGAASSITDTTATLNGTVNPDGNPTTYQFEYGLTTSYGSTTTLTSAGSGTTTLPVSAAITGLSTGMTYHFRITAGNGSGPATGADATFVAMIGQSMAPIVVTGIASNIANTIATLNGTVNPNGSDTTYQFKYGLTTAYGSTTTLTSLASGNTGVQVNAALTGLTQGTVYHYLLTATNADGTTDGMDATFMTTSVVPADTALNISTRVDVETGDNVGIVGFIITGPNPKQIVVRGLGPSIVSVTGTLADPVLELHDSTGAIIATNDNWMTNSPANQMILTDNGLAPTNDSEAAIVMTLDPGSYTAILSGVNGGTGVGLVEAYDLNDPSQPGEVANLSTRGLVGTGDNVMIGGIILGPIGGADAAVVVRAIGPSLANANPPVPDPLIDPVLEIHNGSGDLIASNDNWQTADSSGVNYSARVTAAGLAPTSDAESAIYAVLIAGNYTAIVNGKDATTGVGLVEVYHVPVQSANSAGK